MACHHTGFLQPYGHPSSIETHCNGNGIENNISRTIFENCNALISRATPVAWTGLSQTNVFKKKKTACPAAQSCPPPNAKACWRCLTPRTSCSVTTLSTKPISPSSGSDAARPAYTSRQDVLCQNTHRNLDCRKGDLERKS